MKKILLSLVALFATTFAVAQTQLLNNAGFEEWKNDSEPTYWKTTSTAGNATLSKSEDARSGSYAVQINNQSSNKRLGYQETTLKAGTYTFSFYVMGMAEGGSVRPGYVPVTDGKVGDYQYGSYTNDISATDWQLVTHEFTLSEETTLCLVIMNPKNTASVLGCPICLDNTLCKYPFSGLKKIEKIGAKKSCLNICIYEVIFVTLQSNYQTII
jgi:hypothetical protein